MPTDLYGFPRIELPMPRVLYARRGTFEYCNYVTLPTASDLPITAVAAVGPLTIEAGGLANPSGNPGAAVSLTARVDGTLVGEARITTDANDDIPVLHQIPANSPWYMRLDLWPAVNGANCSALGVGWGGLNPFPRAEVGVNTIDVQSIAMFTSAATGLVRIGLGSSVLGVAAVAVLLDWVRVLEYPELP